jgi:molybdopterin-guanine dinucleotide biosynthesis protein A
VRLEHVEGAVLVGGASRRMGRDKATLDLDGATLVERVAAALGACVARVRIVCRPDGHRDAGFDRIEDRHAERAPLVGICAALRACEASAMVIAACDLPRIEPRIVLALAALVPVGGGPQIVAPVSERGPEPLLAVYRPSLVPEIEQRIARGELSLQALLLASDTLFVPAGALRAVDPGLLSFRNLNRPEDIEALREAERSTPAARD